eukprot:3314117-Ditylum_brightwellii.AAC.1
MSCCVLIACRCASVIIGGYVGASPGFVGHTKCWPVCKKYVCRNSMSPARPLFPPPNVDLSIAAFLMS